MKQFISLFFILLFFASCKSTSSIVTSVPKKEKKSNLADQIIESASDKLGIGYKTAGTTKSGYDCSGLVYSTFGLYDIPLPRTSIQQSKTGVDLGNNIKKAEKGDLIFFKTNSKSQINHVGIVIEVKEDEILFIHASTSKGVIVSSTKEPYYKKTFVQLNRVLQ